MSELIQVWQEYSNCKLCDLSQTRERLVFGTGSTEADILIVKDPPSRVEEDVGSHATTDIQWLIKVYKEVFKLRTSVSSAADTFFSEVFVTSAVMCRPGSIHEGNFKERKPKASEFHACRSRLHKTIYAIDPHVILAFGAHATSALWHNQKIRDRKGEDLVTLQVPGKIVPITYSVVPAPSLITAEATGDYDYEDGLVQSVMRAIKTTWAISHAIKKEDQVGHD